MNIQLSITLVLFIKSYIKLLHIKSEIIEIIDLLNNKDEFYTLVS